MKKGHILDFFIILLAGIVIFLYSIPVSIYIKNKTVNLKKEVYLGGDNIVLDYVTAIDDSAVALTNNYATVGTMTYISKDNSYAAVAHDLGTDGLRSGNIYIVPVQSVIKSTKEKVGEKNINLGFTNSNGSILSIKDTGVYGEYSGSLDNRKLLEIGMPSEIKLSEALIYTNIDGNEVKAYKILIEKVYYIRNTHNIYIKIIDDEMIEKTGGIIAGMSGSPIVQNGKIIGALSHVDDENALYGYGLFITNMI